VSFGSVSMIFLFDYETVSTVLHFISCKFYGPTPPLLVSWSDHVIYDWLKSVAYRTMSHAIEVYTYMYIFNLRDTDIDMCTVIIKVIFYERELMDLSQL
jgi:hypothetical protein